MKQVFRYTLILILAITLNIAGMGFAIATQLNVGLRASPAICEATCATHGGWNGQWTNTNPAAPKPSVCDCNTCPIPSPPTAG